MNSKKIEKIAKLVPWIFIVLDVFFLGTVFANNKDQVIPFDEASEYMNLYIEENFISKFDKTLYYDVDISNNVINPILKNLEANHFIVQSMKDDNYKIIITNGENAYSELNLITGNILSDYIDSNKKIWGVKAGDLKVVVLNILDDKILDGSSTFMNIEHIDGIKYINGRTDFENLIIDCNLTVLYHEIGHYLDEKFGDISKNKDFKKMFKEDRSLIFKDDRYRYYYKFKGEYFAQMCSIYFLNTIYGESLDMELIKELESFKTIQIKIDEIKKR